MLSASTCHKEKSTRLCFIGNGGSSEIASHMTADYMKKGGMNTYGLYGNVVTICVAWGMIMDTNIYSQERWSFLLREGDSVVITLTGFQADNRAKQTGDINVYVPCNRYGIVEYHWCQTQ